MTDKLNKAHLRGLVTEVSQIGVCERREGCVCGGDTPAVRAGCSYFSKDPLGPKIASALASLIERNLALEEALECDCTQFPLMEAKLIEVANRISGMRGKPPCHPDPIMLSEWVAEINQASLSKLGKATPDA